MCFGVDMWFCASIGADWMAAMASDQNYLEGTAYSFSSSSPQLDETSKIVMQSNLGAMNLSGICTYLTADLRGTLPRKPTSIASRMALLAGSDPCPYLETLSESTKRRWTNYPMDDASVWVGGIILWLMTTKRRVVAV